MISESQIKLNYYIYLNLIGIIFSSWLINHYVYDDNLSFGIITGIYDPFILFLVLLELYLVTLHGVISRAIC